MGAFSAFSRWRGVPAPPTPGGGARAGPGGVRGGRSRRSFPAGPAPGMASRERLCELWMLYFAKVSGAPGPSPAGHRRGGTPGPPPPHPRPRCARPPQSPPHPGCVPIPSCPPLSHPPVRCVPRPARTALSHPPCPQSPALCPRHPRAASPVCHRVPPCAPLSPPGCPQARLDPRRHP